MTKIFDLTVETTEIQAVVTKTYEGSGKAGSSGPKMNIEWIDLNEEVQSKGSIHNNSGLEEGDYYTILVDAKIQSRLVLSTVGNIGIFLMGLLCTIICFGIINVFYCYPKYYKE